MAATELLSHPFAKAVLAAMQPHLENSIGRIQASLRDYGTMPAKVNDDDSDAYYWVVGRRLIAVTGRLERLRQAAKLIAHNPSPALQSAFGADRGSWIEYNYAAYSIALASIGDIVLLMTNDVFALGLSKKNCTADVIKTNKWVRATEVKDALDELEKLIEGHRHVRNLYLHRGEGPDLTEISDTGAYQYLQFLAVAQEVAPDIQRGKVIRRGYSDEADSLTARLETEISQTARALQRLFDTFNPIYSHRRTLSLLPPKPRG